MNEKIIQIHITKYEKSEQITALTSDGRIFTRDTRVEYDWHEFALPELRKAKKSNVRIPMMPG